MLRKVFKEVIQHIDFTDAAQQFTDALSEDVKIPVKATIEMYSTVSRFHKHSKLIEFFLWHRDRAIHSECGIMYKNSRVFFSAHYFNLGPPAYERGQEGNEWFKYLVEQQRMGISRPAALRPLGGMYTNSFGRVVYPNAY
jgi:hypothetical protein